MDLSPEEIKLLAAALRHLRLHFSYHYNNPVAEILQLKLDSKMLVNARKEKNNASGHIAQHHA